MNKQVYKIKAVIFDMDGVITNTMPDHYKSWKIILKDEGVNVTHYDIYSREGQTGISSLQGIFSSYQKQLNRNHAKEILDKKEKLFKKIVKKRFINGSRSFLKTLYKQGFVLALVTGTSRHELHKILPDSICALFDVIITGSDVKKGKPHPEPFLKALKKLRIPPDQAVVIENAPLGISSAKAAGIACIAIETSLPKAYLSEADSTYKSIKELRASVNFMK
ncbi:MAG: HAD family phosphatase [Candidatus Omnitrophica bacterium]|nr:HAD family phosphatase [Candidatus Omnitrophota bacterium]MBU1996286.1 HAD family phosphatase [Candidatus Omnitrophota bacterium]MBU4333712.1 HAD family phosphatase [Candidatus Omnitrophota bacterium]